MDLMFHRRNTDTIMTLMKYSLDLSNPWITQYYQAENDDMQTLQDNRNMYKLWVTGSENELIKLFLKKGQHNFPNEYG